ncbi:hypothetical protein SA496_24565 [Pseudomonas sp. JS3066]|uniref:hypothetical protein n=1 Tax=Pseudomonas sp. JS3066 TaxID=3090665 RepID=UPI002E7C2489|nr:hypothetical protein [Pseudomonas sp. JS3066]WVK92846.1 hypothetical protein SA496_24565 [Pseudomonas sp. JS3066]
MDKKQLALAIGLLAAVAGCDNSSTSPSPQSPQTGAAASQQADIYAAEYKADSLAWKIDANSKFTIPVSLKNTSQAPWDSAAAKPVFLSYHWLDAKSKKVLVNDGLRTRFGKPVSPGEEVAVQLTAQAPKEAGSYILQVSLVHEGVVWFESKKVKPLELNIQVE